MPKTVHVCISSGSGFVILDVPNSTRDSALAVEDVPDELSGGTIIHRLQGLTFFPWPKRVSWPDIADKPAGSIIHT